MFMLHVAGVVVACVAYAVAAAAVVRGRHIAATALIAATFTADACHENASAACIKSDANRCNR